MRTGIVFDALLVSRGIGVCLIEALGESASGPVVFSNLAATAAFLLPAGTFVRGGELPLVGRCAGAGGSVRIPSPLGRGRMEVRWAVRPAAPDHLHSPERLWSAYPAALDIALAGLPPGEADEAREAVLHQVGLLTFH
ncbi:hypothetical protein BIV57_02045 [Mangrovactinospora gilvigrisea]|uniref:Uncharacterized protein n=1 Tax=Mangrovactinospora gilvigrisea TaxID=1428644 RepID=A0A1J7BKC8_9ACTN|nr:hypothetical protein BIV57_02045 [Mangrovactinospora gilvigrisea]